MAATVQARRRPGTRSRHKVCVRDGCQTKVRARGLCERHYQAWRKSTPPEERRLTSADRFWAKVDKQGPVPAHATELGPCWIWTGATTAWGYGKLAANKVHYLAHRRSYEMAHGFISEDLFVCRRCDTPACVRPDHLFLGTPAENTRDMLEKGRAARRGAQGERNSHHKLSEEQVLSIRDRFHHGELIRSLAAEYQLHVSAISSIVNGRTWKHLGGPIRPRGQIGRRPKRKVA